MQECEMVQVARWDCSVKTCDRCKRSVSRDGDVFEFQEFQFYFISGGYGSVFGDPANLECDLCQHCVKELIGPYLRESEQG